MSRSWIRLQGVFPSEELQFVLSKIYKHWQNSGSIGLLAAVEIACSFPESKDERRLPKGLGLCLTIITPTEFAPRVKQDLLSLGYQVLRQDDE